LVAGTDPPVRLRAIRGVGPMPSGATALGSDVAVVARFLVHAAHDSTLIVRTEFGGRRFEAVAAPDVDTVTIRIADGSVGMTFVMPCFAFPIYGELSLIDAAGMEFVIARDFVRPTGEPWTVPSTSVYPGRYKLKLKAEVGDAIGDSTILLENDLLVEPGRPKTVTLTR